MDTMTAMAIANRARSQGAKSRVFDWHKAARLIREHKPGEAVAGLSMDMEWTSGVIYSDGKANTDSYTYLASNWAEPVLVLDDGDEIGCWIWEFNEGQDWGNDWNKNTRWPESALAILNGSTEWDQMAINLEHAKKQAMMAGMPVITASQGKQGEDE